MRKLGKGQSVVFCVPPEIEAKINDMMPVDSPDSIGVHHILRWAIHNTGEELKRGKCLRDMQRNRHERHQRIWKEQNESKKPLQPLLAKKFLKPECRTLRKMYRPVATEEGGASLVNDEGAMEEEQERELAPEVEAEQEKEKPPAALAATHTVDPDVEQFIASGMIDPDATGYELAFPSLRWTSATSHFDVEKSPFTTGSSLFTSADFSRTIRVGSSKGCQDGFLRPVQWILSNLQEGAGSRDALMIISPFEANHFFQSIAHSERVTLHMFTPHINKGHPSLDALGLFTVPARPDLAIPDRLVTELILFSGQLYLSS